MLFLLTGMYERVKVAVWYGKVRHKALRQAHVKEDVKVWRQGHGRFISGHLLSVDACPGLQMVQQDAPPTPLEVGVPFKGGPVEPPAEAEEEVGEDVQDDGYETDDEAEEEEGEDNP